MRVESHPTPCIALARPCDSSQPILEPRAVQAETHVLSTTSAATQDPPPAEPRSASYRSTLACEVQTQTANMRMAASQPQHRGRHSPVARPLRRTRLLPTRLCTLPDGLWGTWALDAPATLHAAAHTTPAGHSPAARLPARRLCGRRNGRYLRPAPLHLALALQRGDLALQHLRLQRRLRRVCTGGTVPANVGRFGDGLACRMLHVILCPFSSARACAGPNRPRHPPTRALSPTAAAQCSPPAAPSSCAAPP